MISRKLARLTLVQRIQFLEPLIKKNWRLGPTRDAITKKFISKDFITTWGFMTGIALKAEKMDHHPEYR